MASDDVVTLDVQLMDRSKDVVKSGGEWLSTIDIENIAISHPAIVMVVRRAGAEVAGEEVLALYKDKLAL